jgi:YHS domain-containing protein
VNPRRNVTVKNTKTLIALAAAALLVVVLVAGCPKPKSEPPASPSATATEATPAPPVSGTETAAEPPANIGNAKNADGKYVCPVTGEPVTDFSKANSSDYRGKAYFFCSSECKPEFDKNPEKYAKAAEAGEVPEGSEASESSEESQPAKTKTGA